MNAEMLLADLRARGATFEVRAGNIIVRARRGAITEADRALLRQHKPDLLRLLAARAGQDRPRPALPPAPCGACHGRRWWLRPDGTEWVCATCHPAPLPGEVTEILAPLHDLRAALRGACREYAEALGYPPVALGPGQRVCGTQAGWHAFITTANVAQLRAALQGLRAALDDQARAGHDA